MEEFKTTINDIEITYLFKEKKYDTNHLIVVFSGFGKDSQFTYDFQKSLAQHRASILWIKDDFHQNTYASYYLDPLSSQDKKIEPAVFQLIISMLNKLNLSKDNCTLFGCSKGAASALYYGIKYDFKNIVASAPPILMGSSIAGKIPKRKPKIMANHLLGSLNETTIKHFDSLIIDLIEEDLCLNKNIYLISSKADVLFLGHVKPFLGLFLKYNNFNYIQSESVFVFSHKDVTFYNAPLILSILTQISFNLIPNYINSIISGEGPHPNIPPSLEPVIELKSITFDEVGKLYPEGVGILRGISCEKYSDIDYNLIFKKGTTQEIIKLAKGNRPRLSMEFYKDYYVNYSKAFFCSKSYLGLDLSSLSPGKYELFLEIITPITTYTANLSHFNNNLTLESKGEVVQKLFNQGGKLYYEKIL